MKKKYLFDIFISAIIFLLIIQRILAQQLPFFSYYDEIVLIVFGVLYILRTVKIKKMYKQDAVLMIIVLTIIILGILGNKISGYDRNIYMIIEAILFWFKSFGIFIFSYSYFNNEGFKSNNIISIISRIVKIIVIASFITLILSPFTKFGIDINPYQVRYGLHPFCFIYPQPAIFSWYCILYTLILTVENAQKNKNNFFYLLITSIVWFFTLRSRAFVFIIAYWLLYFWINKIPKKKLLRIKIKHLFIIGIVTVIIAIPAIQNYFVRSTASRAILLRTGIDIGQRYFPLGVGFANYGTTPSYKNYSRVYYNYGFDKIYALKFVEGSSNEITDSYWPAIIGELGFLGLILMILLIVIMYKRLLSKTKNNKWSYMCTLFFIITSLFSSVATPVFSEDIMVGYLLIAILSCYIKPTDSTKNGDNKNECK